MKKILFVLAVVSVGLLSSCNKCKDDPCKNGASCDKKSGDCECTTYYEGNDCSGEVRAKYNNSYSGTVFLEIDSAYLPTTVAVQSEGSDPTGLKYTLNIVTGPGTTSNIDITGKLTSTTEFSIDRTKVPMSILKNKTGDDSAYVEGKGYFTSDSLSATLSIQGYPSGFAVAGGGVYKGVKL
jgi:hypothetical protein